MLFASASGSCLFGHAGMVIRGAKTFHSTEVARAANGDVVIAFFNGGKKTVALVRGSTDAALILIENVAASLRSDNGTQDGDGAK